MKILIVEDDEDKRDQIGTFVSKELSDNWKIAKSLQSGLRAIIAEPFDLILLDMSMTMYDITPPEQGGRPQSYAGKEILMQMVRRGITSNVIVITQFDIFDPLGDELTLKQLDDALMKQFPGLYLGAIHFSVKYDGWSEKLLKLLKINKII